MDDPIEQIKDRVSIADLVERAGLTVVGHGRRRRTEEHPSLSLYLDENSWYWFSQGRGGGVFDWWMDQHHCDFGTALGELARLAGVTLRPLTPERQAAIDQERAGRQVLELATGVYHRALINHPQARAGRDYCNARGWKAATIVACRLGFVLPIGATARNEAPLSAKLHDAGLLEHPLAKAVLSIPPESLVYPHLVGGQVVYLSARSVAGKRHYNLPAELAGPKRLFRAEPIDPSTAAPSAAAAASAQGASAQDDKRRRQEAVKKGTGVTVLCEGQADAISLAQWGFRAVALCGVDAAGLRQEAGRLGISHVGLDNDEAGQAKALAVAWALDPLLKVVTWAMPARTGTDEHGRGVKDANDLSKALADGSVSSLPLILSGVSITDGGMDGFALRMPPHVGARDLYDVGYQLAANQLPILVCLVAECWVSHLDFSDLRLGREAQIKAARAAVRVMPPADDPAHGEAIIGRIMTLDGRWVELFIPILPRNGETEPLVLGAPEVFGLNEESEGRGMRENRSILGPFYHGVSARVDELLSTVPANVPGIRLAQAPGRVM